MGAHPVRESNAAVFACAQVIKYCLRTEEHHGWMMKVYQQLAQLPTTVSNAETDGGSQRSSSCVTPGRTVGLVSAGAELQPVADGRSPSYTRNSSPRGGASFTQQAMHQSEPRDEPQQPSPATTKGFTHQLFSVTASPERTVHDGNGGISGTSRIMDRLCPVHVDTVPPGRSANVGVLQPPRPAQRHIPVYTSHQAARLRAQGLDPTLVTRMGLACSEEVLAGCLARMAGGGGRVGGPMAALAASLRGLDGPVSGQEHAAASASRSSPKRRCAEISVPNVHHKQLERSRDLAQLARNGQSSVVSQTRQNGASEQQVHGTAIEGVNAPLNGSAKAGLGHALAEEEETPAGAQVQQRCDTTASCETTATEEQNADPERANHEQDRARNSSREPSKKRKAGCLAETSNMLSQAATLADFARKKSFTVGTSD